MPVTKVIAIDGQPAEPALARLMEEIDRRNREAGERRARLDADPRIIARRAALAELKRPLGHGMTGAAQIFGSMSDGTMARRSAFASLLRARTALLDGFPHVARQHVRDAIVARRQHWSVIHEEPGMVITREAITAKVAAGALRLADVVGA